MFLSRGIVLLSAALLLLVSCNQKKESVSRKAHPDVPSEVRQTVLMRIDRMETDTQGRFRVRAFVENDPRIPVILIPNLIHREGRDVDTTLAENRHLLRLRKLPKGTRINAEIYWKSYKTPARALLMNYEIVK